MENIDSYKKRIKELEAENRKLRNILGDKSDVTQIAYLEAILHSLPDIVFLIDGNGKYIDVLTEKKSLLYKEVSKLIGYTFTEVLPKNVSEKANEGIEKVRKTGQPCIIEYELNINNESKWFEGRIAQVKESKSEHYVFLVMDITVRKKMTRLLETNQYKLKKAQEIVKLAYFEWDLKTDKTVFSDQGKELFQLHEAESIDMRRFFDFIEPQDRSIINKGLREDIYKKGSFAHEYQTNINGKSARHLIHCELIKNDGEPISVFGIIQDVSYLRKLETDYRQGNEEKNAMLNAIPDMMFIQDADGVFTDFHAPQGQMPNLVAKPENFIGKRSIDVLPPDIATGNVSKLKQVIRTKQHVIHEYTINIDGRTAHFEARMAPSADGKVLSIVREVTARKRAEQELIKAKMIAEESDRLKSAFLANMSHEIRTPINGIVGFAELLLQDGLPNDEKFEYFNIIEKNSHQLLQLIDDIIDISKIEANLLKIKKVEFNINNLLEDLQKVYQKEIDMGSKYIDIQVKKLKPESDAWVKLDKSRVMQILQNLMSNAVKFTEEGEIKMEVKIENNELLFKVHDTGIGIPEMAQKHIFERFRRLDNPADKVYRGTGLGLSVTKGLVELMGGKISVDSREGEGAVFSFTVPFEHSSEPQKEDAEVKDWKAFKNKQVLIVEDEDTSYYYLASILKKNNVTVLRAKTGYEAIEFVKNENIDLILMDIQLPELNGYDATRYIKKISPEIPIVAQTAFALADDEQKSLDAGCDAYVSKPISSATLLGKMKMLLT